MLARLIRLLLGIFDRRVPVLDRCLTAMQDMITCVHREHPALLTRGITQSGTIARVLSVPNSHVIRSYRTAQYTCTAPVEFCAHDKNAAVGGGGVSSLLSQSAVLLSRSTSAHIKALWIHATLLRYIKPWTSNAVKSASEIAHRFASGGSSTGGNVDALDPCASRNSLFLFLRVSSPGKIINPQK